MQGLRIIRLGLYIVNQHKQLLGFFEHNQPAALKPGQDALALSQQDVHWQAAFPGNALHDLVRISGLLHRLPDPCTQRVEREICQGTGVQQQGFTQLNFLENYLRRNSEPEI